jgi:hypothetical protein
MSLTLVRAERSADVRILGSIRSLPDAPGIDRGRWIELIASHPNLLRFKDREGINPFTRAPMIYRAGPDSGHVIVDGAEVGTMTWAQDGSHQISVEGDVALVEPIALEVASKLGGVYLRDA